MTLLSPVAPWPSSPHTSPQHHGGRGGQWPGGRHQHPPRRHHRLRQEHGPRRDGPVLRHRRRDHLRLRFRLRHHVRPPPFPFFPPYLPLTTTPLPSSSPCREYTTSAGCTANAPATLLTGAITYPTCAPVAPGTSSPYAATTVYSGCPTATAAQAAATTLYASSTLSGSTLTLTTAQVPGPAWPPPPLTTTKPLTPLSSLWHSPRRFKARLPARWRPPQPCLPPA